MTLPGRKPLPPNVKELRGRAPGRDSGGRPIPASPKPRPAAPTEPDWVVLLPAGDRRRRTGMAAAQVHADASAEWRRVVPVLDGLGLLSVVDAALLTDYCVCWARLLQCERDISRNGMSQQGERGVQKNPAVTAANQYRAQLRFYVSELGLGPSSRGRLAIGGTESDDDDDLYDT